MQTPNLNWTPRWVELRPHAEQLRLWNDQTRFKVVPAGRRSGKTELAKRRLVEHLFRKTTHGQPGRYFAAAPTRDQAKRIYWTDLKALVKPAWRKAVSESELFIRSNGGAELWVIGLDKAERMEGSPWDGGVIDELANCKPCIWDANIRPALADRRGWCWLIGVPDMHSPGQVEYQRMVDLALSGKDPEWAHFSWPSRDILPEAEVESARRRMDARMFAQEFEGKFVIARGVAFPEFSIAAHVKEIEYDPSLPICWSLDFNIDPMCSGVIQHHKGVIGVIEELTLPDTRTDSACTAFLDLAAARGWKLAGMTIYGDATGSARDSTSGVSDWYIVRNRLKSAGVKFSDKTQRANPPIKDTINAIAAKLKSADGGVSLAIHPRCARLIEDMRSALWPSGNDLRDEHCLAWLRYFTAREYPVTPDRAEAAGGIGFSG
jgi:hypothetical protein